MVMYLRRVGYGARGGDVCIAVVGGHRGSGRVSRVERIAALSVSRMSADNATIGLDLSTLGDVLQHTRCHLETFGRRGGHAKLGPGVGVGVGGASETRDQHELS